MTEMMKKYEAETGKSSTTIWRGECNVSNNYIEWLEAKAEELVRVINAICVLFDNGERKITVGERANLMIAKAFIEKYSKEWTE